MIPKIHHILVLIYAVHGVHTNKNENFQLNYTDYISLFTNTYLYIYIYIYIYIPTLGYILVCYTSVCQNSGHYYM